MSESSQKVLKAAVVGVGYYGSFHAEKYATLPGCELVAVSDHNPDHGERAATEYEVPYLSDHRDLIGKVDVVSVVVPANGHYQVARDLLEAGIHVLVEKPITESEDEAKELIELAREKGLVLQVGHLERFNPAFQALPENLRAPDYIESHRLTPFPKRNVDVSVVLDLMIHDIDLVLALTRSPVTRVEAKGVSVFSDTLDLVNAVLHFESGAVANLTASRASTQPQRTLHLFQQNAYTVLDLHSKDLVMQHRREGGDDGIAVEELRCDNADILRTEVDAFLSAVRQGNAPVVSGEDGLAALATAHRIMEVVRPDQAPMEPLSITRVKNGDGYQSHVTHDEHPETRETVFSRSSLVKGKSDSSKES
ncbi:putative dehydrogenase [Natronospira proteinivora]|uniref:Dehydrogenase n=1 Tax=Natronospira proteinivora TaxID=1807133 RepID=A0ABT1G985_9GAMM|nr:Gfo/Idh/MocA family oxidoreductase [Natronospira proteinivora]MCP1726517.1 putative dehydrogenase [Natronospira proteinivora]